MVGSLVQEIETRIIGIVLDTYVFMSASYKDNSQKQLIERDYYVKWNNGETYWISADKVKVLSENS